MTQIKPTRAALRPAEKDTTALQWTAAEVVAGARVDYRFPGFHGRWKRATAPTATGFAWDDLDEPHVKRKHAILSRHPQIRKLYGIEPATKWIAASVVVAQLALAYFFGRGFGPDDAARWPFWAAFAATAYIIGGTLSAVVGVLIHEIAHSLCFATHTANRLLGLFVNIVLPVPIAMSFRRYHLDHHAYQGVKGKDPDLPLDWEVRLIRGGALTKTAWILVYPLMYCVRGLVNGKAPSRWELANAASTLAADAAVWYLCGPRGLLYLFASLWCGYSLHPGAAHFIQEHYTYVSGQETYSYYGVLNVPLLNIGFHNEHHDFTKVPWSKLPELHAVARESYVSLTAHTSWVRVLLSFIVDPSMAALSRCARTTDAHAAGRSLVPRLTRALEAARHSPPVDFERAVASAGAAVDGGHHPTADMWTDGRSPTPAEVWEGEDEMEIVESAILAVVAEEQASDSSGASARHVGGVAKAAAAVRRAPKRAARQRRNGNSPH